jgi:hypothetical protein
MGYDDEIRQPLDRADWEQREIYAKFGLAIYLCQVVETGLVNYLLILRRSGATEAVTVEEIDEMFVELFGNTLGRNIRNVKQILGEQGEWILADQIAETLKLRNELVHHWMRKRSIEQGTSEKRLAMIEELDEAAARLQETDRLLGERRQAMMLKAGMPEDFVRDEFDRLTELAECGEDDPDAPEFFSTRPDG